MALYKKFPLYIANSLSGKKELFKPINPGHIGMYVCGPTVYNNVHLGNVRTFISFDVIARYFRHLGYTLRYVRNITDVGHLESDNEEDKILKKARMERLEPMEVVQRYTNDLHNTLYRFNVEPPNIEPSATGHIVEQIEFIKKLVDAQFAYEINGSVYFDIARFNEKHQYGVLSGRVIEELMEGSRQLDGQDEKRNRVDFALWKKASPRHIMRWPSPWGAGFPGWHIECTAMSAKYLGQTFDIHGGGMDLKFPHHECEIAQSVGAFGCQPARYWVHTNMLTVNGQKMSKSLGNSLLPNELLTGAHPLIQRGFSAMAVRFFMLQSHYSSTLDLSYEALLAAEKGYIKLMNALTVLTKLPYPDEKKISITVEETLEQLCDEAYRGMSDDFNTAKTLATLFEMVTHINNFKHGTAEGVGVKTFDRFKHTYTHMLHDVLGLRNDATKESDLLNNVVHILTALRKRARVDKDFALSDKIRDDLKEVGIQLKDGKDGAIDYTVMH